MNKKTSGNMWNIEDRYRYLIENSQLMIFKLDRDGNFTFVNKIFREKHGYSAKEMRRINGFDTVHPEDLARVQKTFADLLGGKSVKTLEFRSRTSKGNYLNVMINASPIFDDKHRVTGVIGSGLDITVQKRSEEFLETRARQQAIIADLGKKGLAGTDIRRLLGYAVQEISKTLQVEYCKVLRYSPDNDEFFLVSGVGWKKELVGKARVPGGKDSQAGYTILSKNPVIVRNLATENRFSGPTLLRDHGVVSGVSVVIQGRKGPWGVLGAHTRSRRDFSKDDVNFLQAVANVLVEAIEQEEIETQRNETTAELEAAQNMMARLLEGSSHLLVAGSEIEALQCVTRSVQQAGWEVVAVSLFDGWKMKHREYIGLNKKEIAFLESRPVSEEKRKEMFGKKFEPFRVSRSYFVPSEHVKEMRKERPILKGHRKVQPGDSWDPYDIAYIPIVDSSEAVIGSISIDNPIDGKRPTEKTFQHLEFFADLVAKVVENIHMQEKRKRDEEIQSVLFEISEATSASENLDELYPIIHKQLGRLIDTRNIYIALYDSETDLYSFPYCVDEVEEEWKFEPQQLKKGLTDYVRRTGNPLLVDEEVNDQLIRSGEVEMVGAPSAIWLGVPLKTTGEVFGVIVVQSYDDPKTYTDSDLNLLTFVSEHVAMAIERKRAEEERIESEEIKSVLFQISEASSSSQNLDELFGIIHQQLGRLIDTNNFYIALHDPESDIYSFPYCVDEYDPEIAPQKLTNSLTDHVRKTGRPLLVDAEVRQKLEQEGKAEMQGTPSMIWLGAPLRTSTRIIGVVAVQSYTDPTLYSGKDLQLLSFVSDHIATAIDRKRAEESLRESEEQYRDLFENANDLIQSIAPDGSILYVNRSWLEVLGYSENEARDLNIFDIIHPDSKPHCIDIFRKIMAGEEATGVEATFLTKTGRTITVEGNISCKRENGIPVATRGIFRDVTERKRAERMKDEFISTVSHELRTPLTSIHGSIDLINQGKAGEIPENAVNLLQIAGRNSRRLRNLIDDLLDMQKIETGKMDFKMKPMELTSLVMQMLEENKSFADQFCVDFVMDGILPDVKVNADRDRLAQVMNNLLSNAAKFSPPEGRVEISVSRLNNAARVSVRDHGPGIPEDFREKIFMKFTQADSSRTRARGGTGLGLSIAKSIVEIHGGSIGFETELGVGTTFYFDLPEWKGTKNSDEK